ncbi:MAG: hypothetical protein IKH28_09495 [Lachnospiraceae bacterium]|nr:hypothetical protein [Lachnospiraceae bacterium]
MSYEDEIRIKTKRGLEEAEQKAAEKDDEVGSIYDEKVILHNVETSFEEMQIGDLPCYMYMPKTFKPLTDEQKQKVFARTAPPPFAYGADELILYVSASPAKKPMSDNNIRQFISAIKRPLEAMIPQCQIFKTYVIEKEDKRLGCVECISGGIPMPLYNFMVFASVNGELVILNVYTLNDLKKQLAPYMEEMVKSIRIEGKEE